MKFYINWDLITRLRMLFMKKNSLYQIDILINLNNLIHVRRIIEVRSFNTTTVIYIRLVQFFV